MKKVVCMFCRKEYPIDSRDPQYRKLISGQSKSYVCKSCNQSLQKEAVSETGIKPFDIDKEDKFIR